jgi:ribosomal protein S25
MKVPQKLTGRKKEVLEAVISDPYTTPTKISKKLGCSLAVAFQALRDLRRAGIIEKVPARHELKVPVTDGQPD